MNLQPDDFWSVQQWLFRDGKVLESAALKGIVLLVLALMLGALIGYLISALRYGPGEAFYAVAKSVRDFFIVDLPGTRPQRIFALAKLAFTEARRRKVLFVVGLFLLILMLAGWFLNPDSDDPARLYIVFVLTATNYLMLILALFISCFSLPQDIEQRTIYTIVTKPVRITEIIMGRFLGFLAICTVMLVPMGLASYLFVVRGLSHSHLTAENVQRDEETGQITGETDYVRKHKHKFTIEPGETQGLTDTVRGHQHLVTLDESGGDMKITFGAPVGHLRARIPHYGEIQFYDRNGRPKEAGIDVGQERMGGGYAQAGMARLVGVAKEARKLEHSYVEGGRSLSKAEFTFSELDPQRYAELGHLPIGVSVRAYRSHKGKIDQVIHYTLSLQNPKTGARTVPRDFPVNEYVVAELPFPLKTEGVVRDENGEEVTRELDLVEDLISDEGQLQILLKCVEGGQYVGVTKSGIYLSDGESRFGWNLTKAYFSIWLQMAMIIAFGVMWSTMLNGPVAMLATGVCVLMGFASEMIYGIRYNLDAKINLGGGPIEALVRTLKQDAMTTELDVEGFANVVIKKADAVIIYGLDVIATSLPNLPRMVSTAEYAAGGVDIFSALLARHAIVTLGYCVLAYFASYFILKSREIAS